MEKFPTFQQIKKKKKEKKWKNKLKQKQKEKEESRKKENPKKHLLQNSQIFFAAVPVFNPVL